MVRALGYIKTGYNLLRPRRAGSRALEIGPGPKRLPGFETLDVMARPGVDYVWDASRRLPFSAGTFDLIYASHVLEHIPWFHSAEVLRDWVRVLKPGGSLEIWVPDALRICEAFVATETTGRDHTAPDGWYRFNPDHDPCLWAAGRLFTYGNGSGDRAHPNWHRALFSPRWLAQLLQHAGLRDVRPLTPAEVRGYDHGWINLGMRGTKP